MREFRKLNEEKEDNEAYECFCEGKNLNIRCSCTGSYKSEKIENQEFESFARAYPFPSEDVPNESQQFEKSESEIIHIHHTNSNTVENLCPSGVFKNSKRLHSEETKPNLDASFCSVGTVITPRPTMDESVVPLLQSIFDILQAMKKDQLHLGTYASKNIDIQLDEPFNGLSPLPTSSIPVSLSSSSKFPKQLQERNSNLVFKEEIFQDYINNEENLAISEPPERDFEETSPTSRLQRLIPVDMNLLRTDEELIWDPDSRSETTEVGTEDDGTFSVGIEDVTPSKAQFKYYPETFEQLNLSSLKQSSSENMCTETDECLRKFSNMPLLKKSFQELQRNPISQAIQVNPVSLQNMNSPSPQFSALQNDQLKDLSDEKLLKTSKINKSNESLLAAETSQNPKTRLDIGTDCPDFHIRSYRYSQESTKPSQSQEMSQFIESILMDLKAMNSFRKNNSQWQSFARLPCSSATGGWQRPSRDLSYPVTIETVQELGVNSLFVKWRVQNFGNIGGYEIYLDGQLTNRYFNCIHRAAVICDVDLCRPHRITLRAQPLLPTRTSSCSSSSTTRIKCPSNKTSTTHPEASCQQSDGSVWYPSVYHYEPNSLSPAPTNAVLY